jgi:hypothetical protein
MERSQRRPGRLKECDDKETGGFEPDRDWRRRHGYGFVQFMPGLARTAAVQACFVIAPTNLCGHY